MMSKLFRITMFQYEAKRVPQHSIMGEQAEQQPVAVAANASDNNENR
jgi:hypothetical protein